MKELNPQWTADAIVEVYDAWNNFTGVKDVMGQAESLVRLRDKLYDLFTHHPDWDYEKSEIAGVYDD